MKKISLVVALMVVGLIFAGCRTSAVHNVQAPVITTSAKVTMDQVEKAIILAGGSLGWQMHKVKDGLVKGTIHLRNHNATVDIHYNTKDYSINYAGSSNLKYNSANNTIHSNYNGWVQNLDNAIRTQLSML